MTKKKKMKTIQLIAICALFFLFVNKTHAQNGNVTMKLNYSAAIPTGEFKSFVGNTSFRGAGGEVMYHFNKKFSLGGAAGFQDFYQRYPRALYKLDDGSDISAVVTNSLQTTPILVKAQYNFLENSTVQPYVALGVGGNVVKYSQYHGEFADSKTSFGFAAVPEAGLFVPFRKQSSSGFNIGAAYNIMPYNYGDLKNLNSLGIKAGVSFMLR